MKRKRLDLSVMDADFKAIKQFCRDGVSPEMAFALVPFLEPGWVLSLKVVEFDVDVPSVNR